MKKKFNILVISSFLILTPLISSAFSNVTGSELLIYCQAALDGHDINMGRVQTEPEYIQGVKACEGYLRGISEARSLCSSDKKLVNAAVMVKYLKAHTKQLSLPAYGLVLDAYRTYFFCKS